MLTFFVAFLQSLGRNVLQNWSGPGGEPQDSDKGQRKLRITQQSPANDSVTASYKQNIALKGPGLTGHSHLLLRNDGDTPASSPDKEENFFLFTNFPLSMLLIPEERKAF